MFVCKAKQIQVVNQHLIFIPQTKTKRAQSKEKKGFQETKTVPEKEAAAIKETNKSALAHIRDNIDDALGWVWKKLP